MQEEPEVGSLSEKALCLDIKKTLLAKLDEPSGGTSLSRKSSLSDRRGLAHPNLRISSEEDPAAAAISQLSIASALPSPGLPCEVLPYLYLGCERHAASLPILEDLKITAILNVAKESERTRHEEQFQYKHLPISDHFEEDITRHFQDCFNFINEIKEAGGTVLIHCTAGKSRSPTITMAYLIYTNGWSLRQAYEFLKARRKICPNLGFLCMLAEFEKATLGEQKKGLAELCNTSLTELSILVAEDEEMPLNLTLQSLDKLGYKCDVARNGEQAIRMVLDGNYDLVLMDASMPVMSGIEAAKKIRELEEKGVITSKAVIFVLASDDGLEASEAAGIDAVLEKPFKPDALKVAMKGNLRRSVIFE